MSKSSAIIGDVVAPIILMVFVGYHVGKYLDKMAASISMGLLIGFVVAVFNVWKVFKKMRRDHEY
jgi:F0F1-type ATP synthase assembly protein I